MKQAVLISINPKWCELIASGKKPLRCARQSRNCCQSCFANEYQVCIFESENAAVNGKLEGCPLVPVPDHGDLIDRDKLEKDIDNYIGGEESRSRFHHWVQVQDAVIPMCCGALGGSKARWR